MEITGLIFKILSFLLSLGRFVYDLHKEKKRAATDSNSDGDATTM